MMMSMIDGSWFEIKTIRQKEISWTASVNKFQVNDFVLCRVIHDESRKECYVPGRVLAQPVRGEHQPGFYSVALYTGQQVIKQYHELYHSYNSLITRCL